jgi:hypothetical protein
MANTALKPADKESLAEEREARFSEALMADLLAGKYSPGE